MVVIDHLVTSNSTMLDVEFYSTMLDDKLNWGGTVWN